MKVYLHHLASSVPVIRNIDVFSDIVKKTIANNIGCNDNIEVEPIMCKSTPNNADLCVMIVGKYNDNVNISAIKSIESILFSALQSDQGVVKAYKVMVAFDSSYKPQIPKETRSIIDKFRGLDPDSEFDYEKRSQNFQAVDPEYTFERVILPAEVTEKIEEALSIFKYSDKVFKEWGLRAIEPHPSSSLSFYGPSGTGKTMAAEAIASKLKKKILRVSYADIESKYHGEGPKMVKAIFLAAQRDDAVLFIDEADSLLSKRLTNVSCGSEQAINSMRSQLLISLERFEGIVIFATNLVVNYDNAFLTRLISVEFTLPDVEARKKIWQVHTRETNGNKLSIPFADDVNFDLLAEKYEFCGREIKKAVISACIRAAMNGRERVCQGDFTSACNKIVEEEKALANAKDHTIKKKSNLSPEQENVIEAAVRAKIEESEKSPQKLEQISEICTDSIDSQSNSDK